MPASPQVLAPGPMLPPPDGAGPLRRRVRTLVLVGLIVAVLAGYRPLLAGYARLFRVNDPAPADALLALTGASPEAAALYKKGWAPRVLLVPSGSIPFPDLNACALNRTLLTRQGVPARAIEELPPVRYGASFEEIAVRVREELVQRPVRILTITANAPQTARVRRIFRKALAGTGVEVRMAAVRDTGFDESSWFMCDEGLAEYFKETIETIRDLLRQAGGPS